MIARLVGGRLAAMVIEAVKASPGGLHRGVVADVGLIEDIRHRHLAAPRQRMVARCHDHPGLRAERLHAHLRAHRRRMAEGDVDVLEPGIRRRDRKGEAVE